MGGSSELVAAFRKIVGRRFSPRAFKPDPIDPSIIRTCLSFAQRSPSSFNVQPYIAILVTSEARKEALAGAMLGENGTKVRAAPATVVFAADLQSMNLTEKVVKLAQEAGAPGQFTRQLPTYIQMMSGGYDNPLLRQGVYGIKSGLGVVLRNVPGAPAAPEFNSPEAWAYKQTSLACMTYMHAAAAHGLDTAPMEGFVAEKVCRALNIPCRYSVPMVIATGYAESTPAKRMGRFPPSEVFHDDCFGTPLDQMPVFDFDDTGDSQTSNA